MDILILKFSLYELFLSITFSLISLLLCTKVIEKFILKKPLFKILDEKNSPAGIFYGALIFSYLWIISGSISPAVSSLQASVVNTGGLTFSILLKSFLQFSLFYIISIIVAFSTIGLAFKIYTYSTATIDEIKEIKDGNIAIAIALAFTFIAFSMFVKPACQNVLASLVNYEKQIR